MKKYLSPAALALAFLLWAGTLAPAALAADGQEEPFSVHAASAILVDADYDEILYEFNADDRRYPASITKVMTGLLTVEAVDRGELSLDDQVTLGSDLYTGIGEGGSTQDLAEGEILTVRDLLHCALIPSANEACNALAVAISGNIPDFVDRMNQRAAELGMSNTHFVNTHGYHDDSHYTTARDVAKMCAEAMKHPDFRAVVSSANYVVPATNLHEKRELHDTNALVSNFRITGYFYPYATGIKTGSTPEAGYCLASSAEKNGRTMIAVLLGGINWRDGEDNYFSESRRLLEYGFNSFSRQTILRSIDPIKTLPVSLCAQQDYVTVQPAASLEATLPTSLDPALFDREITLPDSLQAPIEKGQVLGSIHITYEGRDYGSVDLVAATSLERSQFLYVLDRIQWLFSLLIVKLLLLVLVVALLVLIVRRTVFGQRRRKKGRNVKVYHRSYRGRGR